MKVFDCFLFFNELELLDIRLHVLTEHVDRFVLSEATKTFSGLPKPLHYEQNKSLFRKFGGKIIHQIVDDTPEDFSQWQPPNPYFTKRDKSYRHKSGGQFLKDLNLTFQREVYQRDSLIKPLLALAADQDLVLLSDLDEIPSPEAVDELKQSSRPDVLYHFRQKWFMYFLNVYCAREWFGTRACRFSYVKERSMDLLRYPTEDRALQDGPVIEEGGWHFSFLGGGDRILEKLAAYDYQGRRTRWLLRFMNGIWRRRIDQKIRRNADIFLDGRRFDTVHIDHSYPAYIRDNTERLSKLIKT